MTPYLINRQVARVCLEDRFGIELVDFGYRFYMANAQTANPKIKLQRSA